MTTYRRLGINDDVDSCDCCGKTGLKRVVWLEDEHGAVTHFGVNCAARALGLYGSFKTSQDLKDAFDRAQTDRQAYEATRTQCTEQTARTGEEHVILRSRSGHGVRYLVIREKAFNAAPERYRNCSFMR